MSTLNVTNISDGTNSTSTTNVVKGSAKAWVNFNGTGTVAIREAYNVSSISDNAVGQYYVNFTTVMPDTNYCAVAQCRYSNTATGQNTRMGSDSTYSNDVQTGRVTVETTNAGNQSRVDSDFVSVAIFR